MSTLLFAALIGPPLVAAALALVPGQLRLASWMHAVGMCLSTAAALTMAGIMSTGQAPIEVGSLWRIDALSALIASLITISASSGRMAWPGVPAQPTSAGASKDGPIGCT